MTVRVVTDSSAVLPEGWIDAYGIHVVSLELAWPDGSLSRGDVPYSMVAERLAAGAMRSERPPTTGAPSPGTYETIFDHALASGERVIVLTPSAELSSTYRSAELAARAAPSDHIRVIDTQTAAAGQGIVAVEAARAAAAGHDLDAVVERALSVSRRTQIWATLLQLEFLRRSGRIPAVAALGAGALRLEPVVRYTQGSPSLVGVVRSPRTGFERIFREWERTFVEATPLRFVAFHSAREAEANDACERVVRRIPSADAVAIEVPAALAAHTGPGLIGLAWFWDN
jgi:DegV family protein with EDD domain